MVEENIKNTLVDKEKQEVKLENKNEKKQETKPDVKAFKPIVAADNKEPKAVAIDNKQTAPVSSTLATIPSTADNKDKKIDAKKPAKIEKQKKEEAIAISTNMPASKKHCMYICTHIKNRSIDSAIKEMHDIIAFKKPIKFKGEIPHRSYPGIMSGRYPINASKQFIYLLKALKGNVIANGLDLDRTRIYSASATWASRPARRGGTRFKRAYVVLKAKEIDIKEKTKEKKK